MAVWVWLAALFCGSQAAVLPPPWADVKRNPCASHPRGWLMLYWPNDGKCYTIYKKGYPCPDTQELSPGRWGGRTVAECKCPPGTAQLPMSTTCHRLFERGPCRPGEYFAPVEESFNKRGERQGMCMRPQHCADETLLYWPADGRCYYRLSQGPCYPGSILDVGSDGVANCTCASDGPHFWSPDGGCYAHYSRGPCERGQLFLPGGRCGCDDHLPHHHNETGMCYELDALGPCPKGHVFSITRVTPQGSRAECTCKAFHARAADGACYRLYTRGPCANDEMIARGGRCTKVPCARGRLYVPERRRCYRPGTPEPCPAGEVVAFDFEARPALDGLSHNGVCACGGGNCARREVTACHNRKGSASYGGACHTLHTQGPCPENSWLVRDGQVTCRCRPGRLPPDCREDTRKGYPCPDTQELSPGRWGGRTVAECKCPPGTAQLPMSTTCHRLFERGPCRPGEYFAPVEESFNKRGERQGMCMRPQHCADETLLYWPADGRCYYRLSQGPCYPGSILDVGSDGVANCTCASDGPHFWSPDGGCYAHYSRGPCERGQLFLPGGRCGCDDHLPHHHNETGMCYELDALGPCPKGHVFSITRVTPQGSRAECTCKAFHARAADGACYRLYTRGPCANDEMIARGGRCTKVPCARGRLYVPERRRCYRPGTPEPCPAGEVVAFDFEARPALDGLSHNGVCACGEGNCARREVTACHNRKGSASYGGACHTLHTQGPCPENSWLVRDGQVTCRCRPGRLPPDCREDTRVAVIS